MVSMPLKRLGAWEGPQTGELQLLLCRVCKACWGEEEWRGREEKEGESRYLGQKNVRARVPGPNAGVHTAGQVSQWWGWGLQGAPRHKQTHREHSGRSPLRSFRRPRERRTCPACWELALIQ